MEKLDAVIVGAGLAGLSAAYILAEAGLQVIVLERGDHAGSKNVTGGRLYLGPVENLLPDLWKEAPFERRIVREGMTFLGEGGAAAQLRVRSDKFNDKSRQSRSLLRSRFDRWFAEKVMGKGAFVIPEKRVDALIKEGEQVVGARCDSEELPADVVILADGVLSLLAEEAGLKGRAEPTYLATGMKELIEIPRELIESRFGLSGDEGEARLFAGSLTRGMFGGGFLYTNLESISLGIVMGVEAMMQQKDPIEIHTLMEEFKTHPEIAPLIDGGKSVEYSAHLIPEGGIEAVSSLYGNGLLIAGDSAGLALNMGITVRGMDMAIASGVMAARTVLRAKEKKDYSKETLSHYEGLLKESFVFRDLATFSRSKEVLNHPRLQGTYPGLICSILEDLFRIDDGEKEKLSRTIWKGIKEKVSFGTFLKDVWRLRNI